MGSPPARTLAHWDTGETLADRFRAHAADAEHLYRYATRGMADDWDTGGPVRLICRGYEKAPRGAVIHLRLLAGLFRLVLTGRAPNSCGSTRAWAALRPRRKPGQSCAM